MERVEYYDRLVKNIAVKGVAGFFCIGNMIACCFI